jgi:hypothetical protein
VKSLFAVVADTLSDYIDKRIPVPDDLFRAKARKLTARKD